MATFVKTRASAPSGFFEAEAAGLRWLADGDGARVATVLRVEPGRIELERIAESPPRADHALAFGAALARTHRSGAAAFGAAPGNWSGPLYIGKRPLPSTPTASWGEFYAHQRVMPYLATAVDAGNLTAPGARIVEQACALIATGVFDGDEPPSRLHGDLWNGNVLWSDQGVVLIDPAAHGGHRETDLAMLALFGCPYLAHIIEGYTAQYPLRDGWEARCSLHQLHPLAVHAAGHGPNYGAALVHAAEKTLHLA